MILKLSTTPLIKPQFQYICTLIYIIISDILHSVSQHLEIRCHTMLGAKPQCNVTIV